MSLFNLASLPLFNVSRTACLVGNKRSELARERCLLNPAPLPEAREREHAEGKASALPLRQSRGEARLPIHPSALLTNPPRHPQDGSGTVEPRLDSAPNVDPELCLRVAQASIKRALT